MAGDGFGPRAVMAQQGGQACGQGDDAGVLAGSGGMVQAGEQAGVLGPGSCQGLLTGGQGRDRGRHRAGRLGGGGTGLAGGEGVGVLAVGQQPGGGLVPVTIRVEAPGVGTGMLAEQVVHPVPAVGRLEALYWSYSASSRRRAAARFVPSSAARCRRRRRRQDATRAAGTTAADRR